MPPEFTLDAARTAVLDALEQARVDNQLPETEVAELTATISAFTNTFALDEWVFWQPLFKKRICNFPLCFNPPRPVERKGGGNPPAYCADRDETGHPHADYTWARRRRKALRDRYHTDAPTDELEEADRPVTAARSSMAGTVQSIEEGLDKLVAEVNALRQLAERSTDEALVRAEIEAVEHQARESVEREAKLRAAAQKRESTAHEEVSRMQADVEQMDAALEQLAAQAAQDRAERDAALTAQTKTKEAAERDIAEAQRQATTAIDQAQAAFDHELAERSKAMNLALRQAEDRERAASTEVAVATQQAADALAARDEVNERLKALTEAHAKVLAENTALRDAALRREREMDTVLGELRTKHERDRDALQAKIDKMRDDHAEAMEAQRQRHEQNLTDRLHEAAAAADRIHQAEVGKLTTQIESLQSQLDARRDNS